MPPASQQAPAPSDTPIDDTLVPTYDAPALTDDLAASAETTTPLVPLLPAVAARNQPAWRDPPPGAPSRALAASTSTGPAGEGPPHVPARYHPGPLSVRDQFTRLTRDPRMPGWVRRTVLAAATGVPVTAVVNWEAGAGVAALAVTADVLFCARVSGVIPAHVRVVSAQRRSRRRLRRLRLSGYLAVHARRIPGTNSILDHLVVGPGGVFAVDSQYWDRRLPVRASQGGRLYHGPFDQTARLDHARWEAEQVSIFIGQALGLRITVQPAMVIYGPKVPWTVANIHGVDVFGGPTLYKYVRRWARRSRPRYLDERQAAVLQAVTAQLFPPARARPTR
ncbi:MAG TPA: nuclease-related domain-containing protein [Streptosporangiaceae bacterium]|nr:nuclease-related domain-containing protein [Streptosporangiaceae bacterium]